MLCFHDSGIPTPQFRFSKLEICPNPGISGSGLYRDSSLMKRQVKWVARWCFDSELIIRDLWTRSCYWHHHQQWMSRLACGKVINQVALAHYPESKCFFFLCIFSVCYLIGVVLRRVKMSAHWSLIPKVNHYKSLMGFYSNPLPFLILFVCVCSFQLQRSQIFHV